MSITAKILIKNLATDDSALYQHLLTGSVLVFHTTARISNTRQSFRVPLVSESDAYLQKIGVKEGMTLVKALAAMEGAEKIVVYEHRVGISIGEAFDWKEKQAAVVSAIRSILFEGDSVEVEKETDKLK